MSKLTLCKNCNGTKKSSSMGYVTSQCPACHGIGMVEHKEVNHLARTEEKANGEVIIKGKEAQDVVKEKTGKKVGYAKKGKE